jgi:hypothetical protein
MELHVGAVRSTVSIGLDAQTKIPAWLRSCSSPSLTERYLRTQSFCDFSLRRCADAAA